MSMSLCWRTSPRAQEPKSHTAASCLPSASSTMRRNSPIAQSRVEFAPLPVLLVITSAADEESFGFSNQFMLNPSPEAEPHHQVGQAVSGPYLHRQTGRSG